MPLPCYLLGANIVLHLIFWPIVHFELSLTKSVSSVWIEGFVYLFCFYICLSSLPFVERTIFTPLYCLCSLVNYWITVFLCFFFVGPFLGSRFCSNDHFLLLLIPYGPGYYSFITSLRISICPLTLFFSSIRLTALGSFAFLGSVCWDFIQFMSQVQKSLGYDNTELLYQLHFLFLW